MSSELSAPFLFCRPGNRVFSRADVVACGVRLAKFFTSKFARPMKCYFWSMKTSSIFVSAGERVIILLTLQPRVM